MPANRHLVIGADGGIGSALTAALRAQGSDPLTSTRRHGPNASQGALHLDLGQDLSAWEPPRDLKAAYLCAAVTSIDQCRRDPTGTARINVDNTLLLAERLVRAGCFVILPSTNLVFDGATACCPASTPTCPRSVYGHQKAEVEAKLLELGDRVAILRLSKVLTPRLTLFSNWASCLLLRQPVSPFHDMVMAPVTLDQVTRVLLGLGQTCAGGIWQLSSPDDISYSQAALALCRHLGVEESLIRPVSWREACPDLEHVPAHTTLDSSRAIAFLDRAPPPAEEVLANHFRSLSGR